MNHLKMRMMAACCKSQAMEGMGTTPMPAQLRSEALGAQNAMMAALPVVKSLAEQVAEMEAPAVQALLAGEIDKLKSQLATFTAGEAKAHPKAAAALAAAGGLLKKLFPQTTGIVTEIEKLDL